jgi:hypothetical protein
MSMPGFTAEASLFKGVTPMTSRFRNEFTSFTSGVQPASLACIRHCVAECEGDSLGDCFPSCLCHCMGGRHCPTPS